MTELNNLVVPIDLHPSSFMAYSLLSIGIDDLEDHQEYAASFTPSSTTFNHNSSLEVSSLSETCGRSNAPKAEAQAFPWNTKDDTDIAQSDIDPVLAVVDGRGNLLAFADDNATCTYPPVCGFACPSVTAVACGRDERHSVIVRDFGAADATGTACQEGGGYNLVVEVFKADGTQLSEPRVELGGGPKRKVPKYALDLGKAPVGPALDDEDVPHGGELPSTATGPSISGAATPNK